MTLRKRKQPTPHFKLPPPYNVATGKHEPLVVDGDYPYCAMMQIAAADDKDDYVICRGYDTRNKKFYDYDADDDDKNGIPVAKPFGIRGTSVYTVGQVFPALLPLTRIGQTPGVSETTTGHPADLDETVEILYDDDGTIINWMLIDSKSEALTYYAKAEGDWTDGADPFVTAHPCDDRDGANEDLTVNLTIYLPRVIDADPAIYDDNVFAWQFDVQGQRVGARNYFNGKIGEIRAFTSAAVIPEGWEEMDGADGTWDAGGKALSGRDTGSGDANEVTPGLTPGERYHGNGTNDHTAHTIGDHDDHVGHTHTDHPTHTHTVDSHTHTNVQEECVDEIGGVNYNSTGPVTDSNGDTFNIDWAEVVQDGGINSTGLTTNANSAQSHNTTSAQSHSSHASQSHSSTDNRGPRLTVVWAQRVK